jgi:antitoxin ParD1/3/4
MKTPSENSERESRLAELDAAVARGVADADARRVKPASEVFDALQTKLEAKANADQR